MAKYFSGITMNDSKFKISIIDDNLNIIFLDNLDYGRVLDLYKRKSVTVLSIDAPIMMYLKCYPEGEMANNRPIRIKKRSLDNILSSKNLFSYQDRFSIQMERLTSSINLYKGLNAMGFCIKKPGDFDKSIIESYPDTSFSALGLNLNNNIPAEEANRRKIEFLKYKGIRTKDYLKKNKKDVDIEINALCQAYTAYLYYTGEYTYLGSIEEGLLILPSKDILNKQKPLNDQQKLSKPVLSPGRQGEVRVENILEKTDSPITSNKLRNYNVIAEYCGAQYLYTNTDGVIRINDLRPIKSYRPFTEIYEMKLIRQVQVIIGTTDGLRKVKANLIPSMENTNSFKAADDEDKKKLDSFWGNHGDKRGYLIKFNKVEVIKA